MDIPINVSDLPFFSFIGKGNKQLDTMWIISIETT